MVKANGQPDEEQHHDTTYTGIDWKDKPDEELALFREFFNKLGIDPTTLTWLQEMVQFAQKQFCGNVCTLGMMLQAAIVQLYGSTRIQRAVKKGK